MDVTGAMKWRRFGNTEISAVAAALEKLGLADTNFVRTAEETLRARYAVNVAATREHPLINVVSQWIIDVGLEQGPGVERLPFDELRNSYDTVNLLHASHTKVLWPQRQSLTEEVKGAVKDIGKRQSKGHSEENVICREYNFENLIAELSTDPAATKIIVTDIPAGDDGVRDREALAKLIDENPEAFRNVRFFNMEMPSEFKGRNKKEEHNAKTVFQADAMTKAILCRLYEPGNRTPFIEALLRKLLDGTIDCTVEEFLRALTLAGDATGLDLTNMEGRAMFIRRITSVLIHAVKISEKIGQRIMLDKTFWIAA